MQPKLDIIEIEHQGQAVKALRVTPVVQPLQGTGAKTYDINAKTMPREPVIYPLTNPDEEKLATALANAKGPYKSISSYMLYPEMDDAGRAKVLATIKRFNQGAMASFGGGIVADESRKYAFTFSMRYTQEMWGGINGKDLEPAAVFRPHRLHEQPAAADKQGLLPGADLTPAARPLRGRDRVAAEDDAIAESWRPGLLKRHVMQGVLQKRRERPEWMRAEPLAAPTVKTVFTLPDVQLDELPDKAGAVLRFIPTALHTDGQHEIKLAITDPDQIKVMRALVANPRGSIPAEDMGERMPLGTVTAVVQVINAALRDVYAGAIIYRWATQHPSAATPQDDNNDRLSLRFDARYWGPVPPEMAMRNTQDVPVGQAIKARKPKHLVAPRGSRYRARGRNLSTAREDVQNIPDLEYQNDSPYKPGRLVITPKAHHQGKSPMVLDLTNDIEMQLIKGALQRHRSTSVDALFASAPRSYDVSHAARRLNERLDDLEAGLHLHVFQHNAGTRVMFRYDAQVWGTVPRPMAIRNTLPPPKTHNKPREPEQLSLGLRRFTNRWLPRRPFIDDVPILRESKPKAAWIDPAVQLRLPFGRLREQDTPHREKQYRKQKLFGQEQLVLRLDVTTNCLQVGAEMMPLDERQTLLLKTLPSGGIKSLHLFQKDLGGPPASRGEIRDELKMLGHEIGIVAGRPVFKVAGDITLARNTRIECVGA